MRSALALALLLLAPAVPVAAQQRSPRIDLYDTKSNRTGYAIIDPKTGRVDLFDVNSNRTGYGRLDPKSGRIDLYNNQSQRTGKGTLTPAPSSPRGR